MAASLQRSGHLYLAARPCLGYHSPAVATTTVSLADFLLAASSAWQPLLRWCSQQQQYSTVSRPPVAQSVGVPPIWGAGGSGLESRAFPSAWPLHATKGSILGRQQHLGKKLPGWRVRLPCRTDRAESWNILPGLALVSLTIRAETFNSSLRISNGTEARRKLQPRTISRLASLPSNTSARPSLLSAWSELWGRGEVRPVWRSAGIQGRGKRESPEKIRRPAASSGTILTRENPGPTPLGIETCSPRWEASSVTTIPSYDLSRLKTNISDGGPTHSITSALHNSQSNQRPVCRGGIKRLRTRGLVNDVQPCYLQSKSVSESCYYVVAAVHRYLCGASKGVCECHSTRINFFGATVAERLACSPPTKTIWAQTPAGSLRIFACGNRAGRCSCSAGFLGDLPFPTPLHSGAATYLSQSPLSALKTSMSLDPANFSGHQQLHTPSPCFTSAFVGVLWFHFTSEDAGARGDVCKTGIISRAMRNQRAIVATRSPGRAEVLRLLPSSGPKLARSWENAAPSAVMYSAPARPSDDDGISGGISQPIARAAITPSRVPGTSICCVGRLDAIAVLLCACTPNAIRLNGGRPTSSSNDCMSAFETGSLQTQRQEMCRPPTVRTVQTEDAVQQLFQQNPHTSTHSVARRLNTTHTTVLGRKRVTHPTHLGMFDTACANQNRQESQRPPSNFSHLAGTNGEDCPSPIKGESFTPIQPVPNSCALLQRFSLPGEKRNFCSNSTRGSSLSRDKEAVTPGVGLFARM
ncbi:hypothetical protein PR048_027700 [Dryococelus australis]|uniref:Uncharacterized protein n=1 Tax=Dryococelus australis TaxID=614101 RepID=A0ABQ9GH92_9NEOP|nr:hypothetical protein PR048_027700 [Dryococelus australis]